MVMIWFAATNICDLVFLHKKQMKETANSVS